MKLPGRVIAIRNALLYKFPPPYEQAPSAEKDEAFRVWCTRFARQLVFSEPGDGWGMKRAGEGRPISKDTISNNHSGLIAWDLFHGVSTDNTHLEVDPDSMDINDQIFVSVEAVDSLDGAFPPDTTVPTSQLDRIEKLCQDIYDLSVNHYNEHGWALGQIMDKLGIPR